MTLIKIENLKKTFNEKGKPETKALRGVDLNINDGEFIVISGPSGSGKTTLLNLIGGLDSITSGEIFFENESLKNKSESQLSDFRLNKIGFIFQAYNLIPVLTAYENIEYVLVLQKIVKTIRDALIQDISERLRIAELLDKKPGQLSGGQQQRVAVARALVGNPAVILADEPTANLDSENSEILMDIMKEMNEKFGTTFIISSHDEMVISKAVRNIVMKDGRVAGDFS